MKIQNSLPVSSFGGLNFVIQEAIDLNIRKLINANLPALPAQSRYNWFDIIMSYWSVFFCGGDCAKDLSINFKDGFRNSPITNVPSPDRVLDRIKSLSEPVFICTADCGEKDHQFSLAKELNSLNIRILSLLPGFNRRNVVLDYVNTFIFT